MRDAAIASNFGVEYSSTREYSGREYSGNEYSAAGSTLDLVLRMKLLGFYLRPQPTRRTSWKLFGNPGCQPGLAPSFQLVRLVGCGLYR